jgi:hypothetical protein
MFFLIFSSAHYFPVEHLFEQNKFTDILSKLFCYRINYSQLNKLKPIIQNHEKTEPKFTKLFIYLPFSVRSNFHNEYFILAE